jgi:hypothetical protein
MSNANERAVLVTTEHRGVFFGYLIGGVSKEQVQLRAARNVVYWDSATHGFLGLAANGPTKDCRVGPAAGAESTLFDITGVFGVTDQAAKRFEDAPWSR